jgi:peptide/nickel transport system substrate-binding protein
LKVNTGNELRQNILEVMQAQLAQIGVEARVEVLEPSTLFGQILDPVARDFDGVIIGWTTEFRLDERDLFHSERIDQPYAWSGTQNPALDDYLERLGTTVDPEEAADLWRAYQDEIVGEQPYTYLHFMTQLAGIGSRLEDVTMDARGEWVNIRSWYIDPARR